MSVGVQGYLRRVNRFVGKLVGLVVRCLGSWFPVFGLMKHTLKKSSLFSEITASLQLSVPLASAQLAQAGTAFIDTVMMGLLGSQILAAGGLGSAVFSALLIITTGVISAVSPLTAEAHGSGKTNIVGRVAAQGLWLSLLLSIPVLLLIWFIGPILRQLGQAENNVILAEVYLRAVMWGFLPGVGFAALKNFVAALSQPRSVMVIMLCGMIFNGTTNYVLMFGKLGFPALGLAGIGWASTISYWLMFTTLVFYILRQPQFQPYNIFPNLRYFDRRIFMGLVQTGWPIGVLAGVESGLFTVTTFLMGQLGTVTLAAHHIALQTAAVTFMVPLGISFATTVRVGQLMGQGNLRGARLAGFVGMGIGATFMGMMALLFWTMPQTIVSLYLDVNNPDNADVVQMAMALLGVAAMFQLFDGVQIIAAAALRGLKDTRIPMLIGVIAYWIVGLGSGYWLGIRLEFGGVGLWLGLAIGLAAAACILSWRFYSLIAATKKI